MYYKEREEKNADLASEADADQMNQTDDRKTLGSAIDITNNEGQDGTENQIDITVAKNEEEKTMSEYMQEEYKEEIIQIYYAQAKNNNKRIQFENSQWEDTTHQEEGK